MTPDPANPQTNGSPDRDVRALPYPTTTSLLLKWYRQNLHCERLPEGRLHFTFQYHGRVCRNVERRLTGVLNAVLTGDGPDAVFERGWMSMPEEDDANTRLTCVMGNITPDTQTRFFELLKTTPAFTGQTIEQILTGALQSNPGGCLCTQPMRNHKWRLMLATIHYGRLCERVAIAGPEASP